MGDKCWCGVAHKEGSRVAEKHATQEAIAESEPEVVVETTPLFDAAWDLRARCDAEWMEYPDLIKSGLRRVARAITGLEDTIKQDATVNRPREEPNG